MNLENDLDLLAPNGRVVIIWSRGRIEIDPRATMGKETEIRGLSLFKTTPEEMEQYQAALYKFMEQCHYKPVISKTLSLADASQAHNEVMQAGNCGKILLIP